MDGIDPDVYRRRWATLGVLCLSLLIIMVGNTALNVALPTLSRDLPATNSQLQWMVDAYSLVFAGLLFTAGTLGDRYGRKGILQAGLVLFGLATLYAATLADTAGQLIGARIVMGAAGAMVMPATLSILTNVFPRRERAKAVAIWAGISGAGTAIGPLLTGFVLEHFAWNAVFAVNLPFIIAAVGLGMFLVPRSRGEHESRLDLVGALLSAVGLSTVVYAIIEGPVHGWLSPVTLGVGVAGLAVIALFVWWELRIENPMLDVRLFKVPAFGISSLALTLVFFALMGMFFSMSLLLQLVWGYSPLESAVRMLPVSVFIVLVAPRSASLAERYGKRRVVAGGMGLVSGGVLTLALVGSEPSYLLLLVGIAVMASGMGLAMAPTTDLLMSSVPREKAGMGSAMNDTTRELGGSLGVAVFGSLLASRYAHSLAPSLEALPQAARDVAEGSLGGALTVAGSTDGAGAPFVDAAKDAWMSGFRLSIIVGAAIVALVGVMAYRFLPDEAADMDTIPPDGELDDEDLVLDTVSGVAPAMD
ncbi:MAG: DHA2 family efflux MFS transporter permease subunit [Acidimicrobiia bacterium]|nr:DHA2 family efflux MFS transporter permease subunit [Acidimicrobiia bacterium]